MQSKSKFKSKKDGKSGKTADLARFFLNFKKNNPLALLLRYELHLLQHIIR